MESCQKGLLSGHKVVGVRMVLVDGMHHEVDSSDWAFHQATQTAIGKNYALKIRIDPVTLSFSIYRKNFFQFMFY